MRVWFLKETKTIDVNCGTGANITIGVGRSKIYRITPRENNDVNCVLAARFAPAEFQISSATNAGSTQPAVKGQPVDWRRRFAIAAEILKSKPAARSAMHCFRRGMTNEELFLARRLARALKIEAV